MHCKKNVSAPREEEGHEVYSRNVWARFSDCCFVGEAEVVVGMVAYLESQTFGELCYHGM